MPSATLAAAATAATAPRRRLHAALALLTLLGLAACGGGSVEATRSFSLDEKLVLQQARFDQVQQRLAERHADTRVPLAQRSIGREQWERWLTPPPSQAFSAADLAQLQARQARQVQASRALALQRSSIDLQALRAQPAEQAQPLMRQFCQAMPKGGMLHVHPWGNLTPQTYRMLLEQRNPVIDAAALLQTLSNRQGRAWLYPEELAWLAGLPAQTRYLALAQADRERLVALAELPPGAHRFERFEAIFRLIALAIGDDWDRLVQSYDAFAQRAQQAGLSYIEFTESIAPEEVARYEALAQRLQARYGLTVRFNNAFFRTDAASLQDAQVQAMLAQPPSPYIPGIDLLADESDTPALEHGQAVYGPVLAQVRLRGMPWRRTMHAGELGDARNPRDALLLGAERLGHGVRLIDDPLTLEYAASRAVPVEVGLSSNLQLGAVQELSRHPFLTYLRLGLPVSLATDDEGMFATDIVNDCVRAVGQTDVTYHELKEMALNSLRSSFAQEEVKARLLQRLQQDFTRFEQSPAFLALPRR